MMHVKYVNYEDNIDKMNSMGKPKVIMHDIFK